MSIKLRLKHSSVANKAPLPTDLVEGELALNINNTSPAAYIKDSAGAVVKLAGIGSVSTVDATEIAKGVVELATAAETTAGTDATRAVHPAGLKVELDKKANLKDPSLTGVPKAPTAAAGTNTTQLATTAFVHAATPDATTTKKGVVQLADAAAITAGTAGHVVDAAQLKAIVPAATETKAGKAELATKTEVAIGTDDERIVTPLKLRQAEVWTRNGTTLATKIAGDVVNISAGTAALPGLTPVGDPNTGIYSPGADQVAVSTGGAQRITVDASGRFLVGTPTSRSNLFGGGAAAQLESEIAATAGLINASFVNNGADSGVVIGRSNGSSVGSNAIVSNGDRVGYIDFQAADGTNFSSAARIAVNVDGPPSAGNMPGRLEFTTTQPGVGPTERMRIGSTGRFILNGPYFDVVGGTNRSMAIDNTGLIGYVSSTRASKANINSIENHDWLYQLNPVSFNRRVRDDKGVYSDETYSELEYGLIAEEAEKVAPELCFYDVVDNRPALRGVQYTQLITPMLKALQQANQRIEALEAKVAALDNNYDYR